MAELRAASLLPAAGCSQEAAAGHRERRASLWKAALLWRCVLAAARQPLVPQPPTQTKPEPKWSPHWARLALFPRARGYPRTGASGGPSFICGPLSRKQRWAGRCPAPNVAADLQYAAESPPHCYKPHSCYLRQTKCRHQNCFLFELFKISGIVLTQTTPTVEKGCWGWKDYFNDKYNWLSCCASGRFSIFLNHIHYSEKVWVIRLEMYGSNSISWMYGV